MDWPGFDWQEPARRVAIMKIFERELAEIVLADQERKSEWPALSILDRDRLRTNPFTASYNPAIALETLRFIDEELWEPMLIEAPLHEDDWIAQQARKAPRDSQGRVTDTKGINVQALIANAWYRAKQQSPIMHIWISFMQRGLLSIEGLRHPISWYTSNENFRKAARVMGCFSGIRASREGSELFPYQQRTDFHWYWLAIQIVRSGIIKQDRILADLLKSTETLGFFDEAEFSSSYPCGGDWEHDPTAFSMLPDPGPTPELWVRRYYAEWLPRSLNVDDPEELVRGIEVCLRRFERIEKCYYRYFSVPEDEAICEADRLRSLVEGLRLNRG